MMIDIVDPLMKCFAEEDLFTIKEEIQPSANTEALGKLQFLLLSVSNCLKAGDTTSFYMMLKVMREHGGKTSAVLAIANHIMNKLNITADELSHICDEQKGSFANQYS